MAIDYSVLGLPKGPTRKTLKGRKTRAESAVKRSVRAACVERDGYCRVYQRQPRDQFNDYSRWSLCAGPSEWAHVSGARRSQTLGMAPEKRHATTHSLMLCKLHHAQEEAGKLKVVFLTKEDGCDGALHFFGKPRY